MLDNVFVNLITVPFAVFACNQSVSVAHGFGAVIVAANSIVLVF